MQQGKPSYQLAEVNFEQDNTATCPLSLEPDSANEGSESPLKVSSSAPGTVTNVTVPVTNVTLPDTLMQPLHDHMFSIEKSIKEMQQSQHEREKLLRGFIQQEFRHLKASLAFEEESSRQGVGNVALERQQIGLDNVVLREQTVDSTAVKEKTIDSEVVREKTVDTTVVDIDVASGKAGRESRSDSKGQNPDSHRGSCASQNSGMLELWADFQAAVKDVDVQFSMFEEARRRRLKNQSLWHHVFQQLGLEYFLHNRMPPGCLAKTTEHRFFVAAQTLLILSNTCLLGFETDLSIKAALQEPEGEQPTWLAPWNLAFNIAFTVELVYRMLVLRSWFFVCPSDWGWNLFDFFVVVSSLMSEILSGMSLSFIRTFRVLRAVRAARIIRVLRFFRELRKMLFAILASLSSLVWFFVFLSVMMFMFSILFLQGLSTSFQDMDLVERSELLADTKDKYGSLSNSMFTLLAAVSGGDDWMNLRQPLVPAGSLYTTAFVFYILFVIVGVLNVLTGVFLSSADDFTDQHLIIQTEQMKVDAFVGQMLEVFSDLGVDHTGDIDWPTLRQVMRDTNVQAFLAAHQMEPTHARLIFELLDEQEHGHVNIYDLVMAIMRLKGEAKAIDARTIQREVGMIPALLDRHFKEGRARDD